MGGGDKVEQGAQEARSTRFQGQDVPGQDQMDTTTTPPEDQLYEGPQNQKGEKELAQAGPDQEDVGPGFGIDDSWEEFVNTTMGDQDAKKTVEQDQDKEHRDQEAIITTASDQDRGSQEHLACRRLITTAWAMNDHHDQESKEQGVSGMSVIDDIWADLDDSWESLADRTIFMLEMTCTCTTSCQNEDDVPEMEDDRK